ncbi:hypothetical protein B2J93_522 [Marssonina coronariae]|uniref:uridine/cytidine kinase n=1 Tax=Diplocarpon coronariae TaxID=2795749 RepID=A0A218Z1K2_9HELO|nr:hypothetical protein B2J93_522 [Marssonina coronariae]
MGKNEDSFYKTLDEESSVKAFRNEYDFDSPDAIDFDVLVDRLRDLKAGKKAEIPIYSFAKHAREAETSTIYSPHVLVLEGIFALYDPRVLELLDMKVVLRDVEERGRDIEGCIKQWFAFVKPNFEGYVKPQRKAAGNKWQEEEEIDGEKADEAVLDIIVPRGVENQVAIIMVIQYIRGVLSVHDGHC